MFFGFTVKKDADYNLTKWVSAKLNPPQPGFSTGMFATEFLSQSLNQVLQENVFLQLLTN